MFTSIARCQQWDELWSVLFGVLMWICSDCNCRVSAVGYAMFITLWCPNVNVLCSHQLFGVSSGMNSGPYCLVF